jgi:hypothetical protein
MLDAGCWVLDAGCWILDAGCRWLGVLDAGKYRMKTVCVIGYWLSVSLQFYPQNSENIFQN